MGSRRFSASPRVEQVSDEAALTTRNLVTNPIAPDFEEIIRDIDESINAVSRFSNLKLDLPNRVEIFNESTSLLNTPEMLGNDLEQMIQMPKEGVSNLKGSEISKEEYSVGNFQIGWTDNHHEKKGGKGGTNKGSDRLRANKKRSPTKSGLSQELGDETKKQKAPNKGTWTRALPRINFSPSLDISMVDIGPKRKHDKEQNNEVQDEGLEKKVKLDEESKKLSILMTKHLGSAEVAE